jgi:hypothetical protein
MPGGLAGVVPVRQAWHEHALEVGHDRVEGFRVFRRARRERGGDVSRRGSRQDRVAFNVIEVVGNPLDQLVAVPPELRRVHHRAS